MKKTKIICTIGPVSCDESTIKQLIQSGMNVARFNLSHADHESIEKTIKIIRRLNQELETNVGILLDTKGPELHIETFNKEAVCLSTGDQIVITCNQDLKDDGNFFVNHAGISHDLREGNRLLLGDGLIELEVMEESVNEVTCRVLNDGTIRNNMGVNIPGVSLEMEFLSMTDKDDIEFANKVDADYIALSFVRDANDVLDVNDMLINLRNEHMQIIAKIENKNAIEDVDNIIKVSDGIMVARGDLGVEINFEQVPSVQKKIVNKCFLNNKICIVATQMLSSMQFNPRPTRAEVSDVANAVIDGVDAVMLSEETAIGSYPVETVRVMTKIIEDIETSLDYNQILDSKDLTREGDITTIIAHNVVDSSNRVKASAIVASTISGYTARVVSGFRPECPIIVTTPNENVARSLSLYWGLIPVIVKMFDSTDEIVDNATRVVKKLMPDEQGKVIITGGFPMNKAKITNFMKIEQL